MVFSVTAKRRVHISGKKIGGKRRFLDALDYIMLDAGVVAVIPSSVYQVLRDEGLLERHSATASTESTAFAAPESPHWCMESRDTALGQGSTKSSRTV